MKNVKIYNGNPVIYNDLISIKDGTAFCCGVTIGEVKKNYLLPHHQFFMAMANSFKRKINAILYDKEKKIAVEERPRGAAYKTQFNIVNRIKMKNIYLEQKS